MKNTEALPYSEVSRVIEMAWEDKIPFEAIDQEYNLSESDVIALMRKNLKSSSFKLWRKRVSGRKTKHLSLKSSDNTFTNSKNLDQ